ncbi:PLAC8 motif-containing protein [Sesbania bispinosa]|nr:PLAC8 motif-containing protein [Sesbania bispinosa]
MYPPETEETKPGQYPSPPSATGFPVSAASYSTTGYSSTAPSAVYNQSPPPPKSLVNWHTGLCHCSDPKNCCITCWCPCVTFGQVAEIVDKGSTSCGASGALYTLICCVTGCGCCLYSCFYRSKMRQQYGLKGNDCCDCLVHCFCEHCALRQEYRELETQGFNMVIGWHGNVEQRSRGVAMVATAPVVEPGMSR